MTVRAGIYPHRGIGVVEMLKKVALATVLLGFGIIGVSDAQTVGAGGMRSTELQRSEVPGGAYVMVLLQTEMDVGARDPLHSHPGVQIGYLVTGSIRLSVEGQPDKVIKAGESYQVPAGAPHAAVSLGPEMYKSVTSYIVDKTKPIRTELAGKK